MAYHRVTQSDRSTSVMMGPQDFLFHCELHSSCLEQIPEHQPQFMKNGAFKHMGHVLKCAHPGPVEGTLNILIVERVRWGYYKRHTRENSSRDKQYLWQVLRVLPYFQPQREVNPQSTQLRSSKLQSLPVNSWQK